MSLSKAFLYSCIAFVLGILIDSLHYVPQPIALGFLVLGILLASVLWKYKVMVFAGFLVLFLALGVFRHQKAVSGVYQLPGDTTFSFSGKVSSEPEVGENSTKLTVSTEDFPGKVLATASNYPEYKYGDLLKITGTLRDPGSFDGFDYGEYLAKDGVYLVTYYPEIEKIGRADMGFLGSVYGRILIFKGRLRQSMYSNLSPPQSSVLGAMILGDKSRISDALGGILNEAGLRHITAISGMHVTIISVILMQVLLGMGLWRGQAFYITLALLLLFVVMVGLPASAVRAGIMAGLLLWAQKLGRAASSFRLIVFAAVAMLAFNPLLLKSDVGFQLSFLAVAGIIFLSPHFKKWLSKVPDGFLNMRSVASMTLSAQVFTLPVLIYNFSQFSLIAPVSNILVLPVLPFALASGFIFSFSGIVWPFLGWVLSWPSWLLMTYILKVSELASSLPGSFLSF